ncbi:hypothetical protein C8J57DRAFT_1466324 [Mycena rebaudengoi]|nr:hypothetical protein C8J57DRAFT_1466324 [Mycena rebaudengoi]
MRHVGFVSLPLSTIFALDGLVFSPLPRPIKTIGTHPLYGLPLAQLTMAVDEMDTDVNDVFVWQSLYTFRAPRFWRLTGTVAIMTLADHPSFVHAPKPWIRLASGTLKSPPLVLTCPACARHPVSALPARSVP